MSISRREMLLHTGLLAGVTAMGRFAVADSAATPKSGADANLFTRLDEFVRQYMEEMKAPGMTVALADRKGVRRVVHYGFGDVEHRAPVQDDELFEIGSISKSYVGHYRNENPWIGSIRIVLRKGRLWIDGMMPLEAAGDRFSLRDQPHSPEWIQFGEVVNGRCMRLKLSGEDLWRVATA